MAADPDRVLLLDVETTGLSRHYDSITLIGWEFGGYYEAHVAGDCLDNVRRAAREATSIVTFNGKLFDVPFLRKECADLKLPPVHLDLRFAARRLGLTGGQKAIEQRLAAGLRDGLTAKDGAAAVLLWHKYLRGDPSALRELIDYNRADVRGMAVILDHLVDSWGLRDSLFEENRPFRVRYKASLGVADGTTPLPPPSRLGRRAPSFAELFEGDAATATIVGIDLTGSQSKPSGLATLRAAEAKTARLAKDDDIVAYVRAANPRLVSIDSPLSLPRGRTRVSDDDPGRAEFGIMRVCERELKRRGINVYPSLLPSMQKLTARGMALADRLRSLGIPVIESYPGAAQDILGIPRKGAGPEWLAVGLREFGLCGDFTGHTVSHDELDAITSALVGTFFLAGRFEALTGSQENALIVPLVAPPARPYVVGISGRIAAGKTTAARELESRGFAYARFSQVIDDEILSAGVVPDRVSRQEFGMHLHDTKGQRWLCERVLDRAAGADLVVVDGLRWIEDATFFLERLGPNFVHVHVDASAETRGARYVTGNAENRSFAEADSQPVEREIDALGRLARVRIINETGIGELKQVVSEIAQRVAEKKGQECRSRSS